MPGSSLVPFDLDGVVCFCFFFGAGAGLPGLGA